MHIFVNKANDKPQTNHTVSWFDGIYYWTLRIFWCRLTSTYTDSSGKPLCPTTVLLLFCRSAPLWRAGKSAERSDQGNDPVNDRCGHEASLSGSATLPVLRYSGTYALTITGDGRFGHTRQTSIQFIFTKFKAQFRLLVNWKDTKILRKKDVRHVHGKISGFKLMGPTMELIISCIINNYVIEY